MQPHLPCAKSVKIVPEYTQCMPLNYIEKATFSIGVEMLYTILTVIHKTLDPRLATCC